MEVVLRTVTLPENKDAPILETLQSLCCRVLATSAERKKIDDRHAWTIPVRIEWQKGMSFGVRMLTPSLLPLIRYHEVDPALALSLVPLSLARKELYAQFCKIMKASTFEEVMKWYETCKRKPETSFVLSDDIYRGTTRLRNHT